MSGHCGQDPQSQPSGPLGSPIGEVWGRCLLARLPAGPPGCRARLSRALPAPLWAGAPGHGCSGGHPGGPSPGDPQLPLGALLIKHDFTPRRLSQQVISELTRHQGAFQKPGRSPGRSCWHRMGLDAKTVHWTKDLLVRRGERPDGTSQRQVGGQSPSPFANLGAGRMGLSRWTSRGDPSMERSGPVTAGMCPSFLHL